MSEFSCRSCINMNIYKIVVTTMKIKKDGLLGLSCIKATLSLKIYAQEGLACWMHG